MSIFKIHHITRYEYDRPVKESANEIRIYPYQSPDQETLSHEIKISTDPEVHLITDYWGNRTGSFNILDTHRELTIESKLVIRILATTLPSEARDHTVATLSEDVKRSFQLIELSRLGTIEYLPELQALQATIPGTTHQLIDIIQQINEFIYKEFKYIKGITTVESTVPEILTIRSGVCQDFAHVMLDLLRLHSIPCRYVSGYICPNKNGLRGEGATHAWVEVWVPGHGWAGIDPTNNIWVAGQHVKLAVGRNFSECTPVRGTFKGPAARQSLSVYVSVGYEDGQIFEDINNVRMEKTDDLRPDEDFIASFSNQQQ
jgi:transglutaminase-like putative cysteine protease